MNPIIKNFFSSVFFLNLRNFINIKPSISLKPNQPNSSVSDFFYWDTRNSFDTRMMLSNYSTQTLPNEPQNDLIKIFIYDNTGSLIKKIEILLKPFETIELIFSKIIENKYGSFFVFHKLNNTSHYEKHNSFISERGYISYRQGDGVWSFMHGNLNSAFLNEIKDEPQCLFTSSHRANNTYLPQVSFKNCNSFSFILNNPSDAPIKILVEFLGHDMLTTSSENIIIQPFSTIKYKKEDKKVCFFKISSKIIFLRPIIMKELDTYFDIFHG